MRAYLIDELAEKDVEKIKEALSARGFGGGMADIFFVPVPEELLTQEQEEHKECAPHIMAVETGETWVKLELLVRAKGKLRCSCITYAAPKLREYMQDFLDGFIRSLDIPV